MPTVGAGSSQCEDSPAHRLHPPCGSPPPAATPAMRIPATPPIAATIPAPSPYHRRTNQRPTPYQPKTIVASCSDFALRRNPNMKRRWYGDGTTMVRRISGDAPWLGAKVGAAVPCVAGRSGDTGDPALAGVAEKTPVMRAVFFVTTSSTPPFSICPSSRCQQSHCMRKPSFPLRRAYQSMPLPLREVSLYSRSLPAQGALLIVQRSLLEGSPAPLPPGFSRLSAKLKTIDKPIQTCSGL